MSADLLEGISVADLQGELEVYESKLRELLARMDSLNASLEECMAETKSLRVKRAVLIKLIGEQKEKEGKEQPKGTGNGKDSGAGTGGVEQPPGKGAAAAAAAANASAQKNKQPTKPPAVVPPQKPSHKPRQKQAPQGKPQAEAAAGGRGKGAAAASAGPAAATRGAALSTLKTKEKNQDGDGESAQGGAAAGILLAMHNSDGKRVCQACNFVEGSKPMKGCWRWGPGGQATLCHPCGMAYHTFREKNGEDAAKGWLTKELIAKRIWKRGTESITREGKGGKRGGGEVASGDGPAAKRSKTVQGSRSREAAAATAAEEGSDEEEEEKEEEGGSDDEGGSDEEAGKDGQEGDGDEEEDEEDEDG